MDILGDPRPLQFETVVEVLLFKATRAKNPGSNYLDRNQINPAQGIIPTPPNSDDPINLNRKSINHNSFDRGRKKELHFLREEDDEEEEVAEQQQ